MRILSYGDVVEFDQIAIVVLLATMLVAFASERWRVETVAIGGLAIGFALGLVPADSLFRGFSSPAVVTVVEILLIVSVLSRSRLIDDVARRLALSVSSERGVLAALCATGAFISVFMNNIGALALMFPVALSLTQRLGLPPGRVLMALSFATLLGGMCSLTGTPANLVVNEWMLSQSGRSMGYFDLGAVGLPMTILGVAWLALAAPRIFARFAAIPMDSENDDTQGRQRFLAQRAVAAASDLIGRKLAEIENSTDIAIHGVLRDGKHVFARRETIALQSGDMLLIEAEEQALERLEAEAQLTGTRLSEDEEVVAALVMPESLMVGSRVEDLDAMANGLAWITSLASRRGRVEGRFGDLQFSTGDIVNLAGSMDAIRSLAREAGLLLMSPRRPVPRPVPRGLAVGLFAAGIAVTAFDLAPVEVAFGGVVLTLIVTGLLDIRRALADINWRIVVLLACMIPVGLAVDATGAARVLADAIAEALPANSPLLVLAAVLAMGVALTPFIDNVSTAVVLSPIAAELAVRTATPIEPLLIAVAIGASIDFLTPFGHHNNAIVMGVGNYRFSDFARLGAPLTAICFVTALAGLALYL